MKELMASLKPYYYYLIGEGIKKWEVRKNSPKANDWSRKVNFYISKDIKSKAKWYRWQLGMVAEHILRGIVGQTIM